MASIVSAGTTSATALNMSADTSGVLQLASNNGTVALTVSTSQNVGINATSPKNPDGYNTTNFKFLTLQATAGASDRGAILELVGTAGGSPNYWLGRLGFFSTGNSNAHSWIQSYTDSGGANSGALLFSTTADASTTGPTTRMTISSSGYITTPYQPMFSTTRTGGSVTGGLTATVIVFDNNMVNVSSSYNNSNGRFTAPVAGTYYFSACGMLDTSSVTTADTQMIITVNGSSISISNPPMAAGNSPQGMGFAASVIYTLAVGDYVDVRFYSSTGTQKFYGAGGRFNNFSGFLIG